MLIQARYSRTTIYENNKGQSTKYSEASAANQSHEVALAEN